MAETAAPAAPAAAPAPAAPAAPAPQPSAPPSPQAAVDEDAQIIEDLRKEHFAKAVKDAPKPGKTKDDDSSDDDSVDSDEDAKGDDDPESDEDSSDDSGDDGESDEPAKGKGDKIAKVSVPKYKNVKTAIVAIQKAIESGDPKKIAAAIGKPESFLKVSDAKWVAFREKSEQLRGRVREVTKRETEFNAKLAQAKADYEPVIAARAAYQEGNFAQFVDLVEKLTGDTYDEATRKVVKGETSLSPEVKALRRQMAEQAAEIARLKKGVKEEPSPEVAQQQQYQRAVGALREELAQHPITKVKGYEKLVIDMVRNSWDPDYENYTMGFEEAADAIVEERRQEARHFTRGKQLPAPRERTPDPPPRSRASDPHSSPGADWEKRDLTEEELVASIERDYRAGKLRQV